MEWQPIETAPQNGTEVLLFVPDIGVPVLARFIPLEEFLTETEILGCIEKGVTDEEMEEPDWFLADFIEGVRLTDGKPTHWMPLPSAPTY